METEVFLKAIELPVFASYFDKIPNNKDHLFYKKFTIDLCFDNETGLIHQNITEEKQRSLDDIYKEGSTWYQTYGDSEFREGVHLKNRKKQFLDLFFSFFHENKIKGLNILEIGCGHGHILKELKERGANVMGCDPGPYREYAKKKYDIEIINSSFSDKIFEDKKFDIVFSYAFLTGMNNPLSFLSKTRRILNKNGKILTAVADYTRHIELGNIFCISPEQVNYFTQRSIRNLYLKAGLRNVKIKLAGYGCGLQIVGESGYQKDKETFLQGQESLNVQAVNFIKKSDILLKYLQQRIDRFEGKTIGLMGANVETANLLSLINFRNIKMFIYEYDDTFVNKYLPSARMPISHEDEIVNDRPDEIWIIPIAFADKIENKLKIKFNLATPILNLKTFLKSIKL